MIQRKFSKSFEDALEQAYFFHNQFTIDSADFIAASPQFAAPFAANFLLDIQAADALPTNDDDLAQQQFYTSQVSAKMEECRVHYQKLLMYVRLAYPNNVPVEVIFGSKIYEKARNVVLKMINLMQQANKTADSVTYKASLIAAGFLQVDIDKLETLATELTGLNDTQNEYIRQSSIRSEERIVAFNKVWDSMVKISDVSKVIYLASPAHIATYLLYPDNPIPLPPDVPANLAYAAASNLFSWDSVLNATSYQLSYRRVGNIGWNAVYEGSDNFVEFSPAEGDWEFTVRARNQGGYGEYAVPINVNVPEALAAPTNITVTWTPASSTRTAINFTEHGDTVTIDVWQSLVAVGAPAGTYSFAGNFPALSPIRMGGVPNQRIYVYLIAKNSTQESEPSAVAYCDNV